MRGQNSIVKMDQYRRNADVYHPYQRHRTYTWHLSNQVNLHRSFRCLRHLHIRGVTNGRALLADASDTGVAASECMLGHKRSHDEVIERNDRPWGAEKMKVESSISMF
jgi:hypothetical protein